MSNCCGAAWGHVGRIGVGHIRTRIRSVPFVLGACGGVVGTLGGRFRHGGDHPRTTTRIDVCRGQSLEYIERIRQMALEG
jgi:hypothetical protein